MFNRKKLWFSLIVLIMLLAVAAQCGAQPEQGAQSIVSETETPEADEHAHTEAQGGVDDMATPIEDLTAVSLGEGEKLKVVATTTIVGDLAENVAGDLIDLKVLLPPGADTHTFSPPPKMWRR